MTGNAPPRTATRGKTLAHSFSFALLGNLLPLLVAMAAVPLLVQRLDLERFGLVTIIWAFVGYLGILDLGLGRALTYAVARRIGREGAARIPALVRRGMEMLLALGLLIGLVIGLTASESARLLVAKPELVDEASKAIILVSFITPCATLFAAAQGALEACRRFDHTAVLKTSMSTLIFLGSLAGAAIAPNLVTIAAAILVARAATLVLALVLMRRTPELGGAPFAAWPKDHARGVASELLNVGKWITVSNIIGPIMTNLDRFFVSAILSPTMAAYYATPFELARRLNFIPNAVASVLFPAASAAAAGGDRAGVGRYLARASFAILIAIAPPLALMIAFAHELIGLWIDPGFALYSAPVLQIIAAGVMANGVVWAPFGIIQAHGRPDLTAKIQAAQVIPYLIALYFATLWFGIVGCAAVWLLRVAIDGVACFGFSARLLHLPPRRALLPLFAAFAMAALAFAVGLLPIQSRVIATLLLALAYPPLVWRYGLTEDERRSIRARFAHRRGGTPAEGK